ncbi:MAG: hypothetical protein K0S71_50 [Clostridia bacterium]|jgi:hypothetical protein|nr:hypothetical protein [Clostridia bacterium]
MKFKKSVSILVLCIVILSLTACLAGLFSDGGSGQYEYKTINNEIVKIYGSGLYKNDSISVAAQGKASDFVTLVMGIPLLLLSGYFAVKGSFKGKLILTGTLGYFLYTYMSYTFLWMYNQFFIIYTLLMSLSLFAFIFTIMSFDVENIADKFKRQLPVKFLGGFQIFIAFTIGMLWLGKIAPSIFEGAVPGGLEHYTTLVIQGMDLGIVVPAALLSGILLIKRKPFGYLLSSVIIIKGITMLTAISAMIINQAVHSVKMSTAEIVIFPLFNLMAIVCLMILLKNTAESSAYS